MIPDSIKELIHKAFKEHITICGVIGVHPIRIVRELKILATGICIGAQIPPTSEVQDFIIDTANDYVPIHPVEIIVPMHHKKVREKKEHKSAHEAEITLRAINMFIDSAKDKGVDTNNISDGYHTFGELYNHRHALFLALLCQHEEAWKSKMQSDGTMPDGWFIAGIYKEPGWQITYHLPIIYWDETYCKELDKAPEYDGHSPSDVISRLRSKIINNF